MRIVQVKEKDESIENIKELFKEYASSLGFDLSFQDFEEELSNLPGDYSAPQGCLLIAIHNDKISGCVSLRAIDDNICEMKRLYVKPEFRGFGIGKKLALAIIEKGKDLGYKYMRLDTIEFMEQAIKLYERLGFYDIEAYRYNPIKGTRFMELNLMKD